MGRVFIYTTYNFLLSYRLISNIYNDIIRAPTTNYNCNKMIYKILISVTLIFTLLLSPYVLATEEFISPIPTTDSEQISPIHTPTPTFYQESPTTTLATDEANLILEDISDDQNTENTTFSTDPNTALDLNTLSSLISSKSAQLEILVDNTNEAVLIKNLEQQNITGQNNANENITLVGKTEINTGDADMSHLISNIVNTNIIGSNFYPTIINITDSSVNNLNFSSISPCIANNQGIIDPLFYNKDLQNTVTELYANSNDSFKVKNDNIAQIDNTISLQSITGENTAIKNIGDTSITTGNASINLDLFNMANTNLVGDCWFYGVINMFAPYYGDIIMPDDQQILQNKTNSLLYANNNTEQSTLDKNSAIEIINNNTASVLDTVNASANTGDNILNDTINFGRDGSIITGAIENIITIFDTINQNIFGNKFVIVKVNHNGLWTGSIKNFPGYFFSTPEYTLFSNKDLESVMNASSSAHIINADIPASSSASLSLDSLYSVDNTNFGSITNTIDVSAITGKNEVGRFNSDITTGDISLDTNIADIINTNIIGNDWIYLLINVFDQFVGDIIFPRADLSLTHHASKQTIIDKEQLSLFFNYENIGSLVAKDSYITTNIPDYMTLVGSSIPVLVNGNMITITFGNINPKQISSFELIFKLNSPEKSSVSTYATIYTLSNDIDLSNNSSSLLLSLLKISDQISYNNNIENIGSKSDQILNNSSLPVSQVKKRVITPQYISNVSRIDAYKRTITIEKNKPLVLGKSNKKNTLDFNYYIIYIIVISYLIGLASGLIIARNYYLKNISNKKI